MPGKVFHARELLAAAWFRAFKRFLQALARPPLLVLVRVVFVGVILAGRISRRAIQRRRRRLGVEIAHAQKVWCDW